MARTAIATVSCTAAGGEELDIGVSWVGGVRADLSGRDLQRGEQGGGAVAQVVVGLSFGQAWA
jgi:hypothetical protein